MLRCLVAYRDNAKLHDALWVRITDLCKIEISGKEHYDVLSHDVIYFDLHYVQVKWRENYHLAYNHLVSNPSYNKTGIYRVSFVV